MLFCECFPFIVKAELIFFTYINSNTVEQVWASVLLFFKKEI